MTPFGPQLIGETEKTLVALLRTALAPTGLSEHHWVALRIADALGDHGLGKAGLVAAVADRAHFPDAAHLVADLHRRGLLAAGRVTPAGRATLAEVLTRSDAANGSVWRDLPDDDVAATERVLNTVLGRARDLVGSA